MIKAEQTLLLQAANQQVIKIRNAELTYYTTVFESFNTQCALITGFVLQALTNLNLEQAEKTKIVSTASIVFWISSSVVIAASLHCVLTTSLCNIYAPGMALRGPLGSMVRAVEGVVEEQVVIIRSFMLTIASFAVVLVSYSFMTMQPDAATASAVIIIIGSYFWYTYCIRIYNNFKWTDSNVTFTESHHKFVNKIEDQRILLDMHLSLKEGYFCKKDISAKKKRNPWTRHYFVLQGRYLMYFDSKAQFEDNSVFVKHRPINLTGYCIDDIHQIDRELKISPISAMDDRRVWELKFDTSDELSDWANSLHQQCVSMSA